MKCPIEQLAVTDVFRIFASAGATSFEIGLSRQESGLMDMDNSVVTAGGRRA